MTFEILRASQDAAKWDAIIKSLPTKLRDIHFTSAYGRVQQHQGGEAILFVVETPQGTICQPFIKREVPFLLGRYDLCSPYGYSGPLCTGQTNLDRLIAASDFLQARGDWAAQENIISDFCYLHPMMALYERMSLDTRELKTLKQIVVIDLLKMSEATISRRVRRGIAKAASLPTTVVREMTIVEARATFYPIYQKSMERKQAAAHWHFSREYIDAHFSELNARVFYATDSEVERALMVIGAYGTAYAHFLGSNAQSRHNGLDELLYWKAATILRDDGYKYFHLGGGLTRNPDDSLLAFKKGFATTTLPLLSYSRVFNQPVYDELCRIKRAREIELQGHEAKSGYFPAYRRPI